MLSVLFSLPLLVCVVNGLPFAPDPTCLLCSYFSRLRFRVFVYFFFQPTSRIFGTIVHL